VRSEYLHSGEDLDSLYSLRVYRYLACRNIHIITEIYKFYRIICNGFLQKGINLKAEDIANIWDVSHRTAMRDIMTLQDLHL